MSTQSPLASANAFFAHSLEAAPDVVTGILGERQIGYLAGDWSLGKTPLLQELSLSVAAGIPFLGRETSRRPVLVFDAETPYEDYRPSLERIAARLRIEPNDLAHLEPMDTRMMLPAQPFVKWWETRKKLLHSSVTNWQTVQTLSL